MVSFPWDHWDYLIYLFINLYDKSIFKNELFAFPNDYFSIKSSTGEKSTIRKWQNGRNYVLMLVEFFNSVERILFLIFLNLKNCYEYIMSNKELMVKNVIFNRLNGFFKMEWRQNLELILNIFIDLEQKEFF